MDNVELAYLAGIIDGEGHIYVVNAKNGRGKAYKENRICFVQMDFNNGLELCTWVKERIGGNISYTNGCYRWQLTGKKAVDIARQLQPLLIVKKEQIKRIL